MLNMVKSLTCIPYLWCKHSRFTKKHSSKTFINSVFTVHLLFAYIFGTITPIFLKDQNATFRKTSTQRTPLFKMTIINKKGLNGAFHWKLILALMEVLWCVCTVQWYPQPDIWHRVCQVLGWDTWCPIIYAVDLIMAAIIKAFSYNKCPVESVVYQAQYTQCPNLCITISDTCYGGGLSF